MASEDGNMEPPQHGPNNTTIRYLVILTLERHRHGVWITRLLESLELLPSKKSWENVHVVSVESIFPMDPNHENNIHSILLSQLQPERKGNYNNNRNIKRVQNMGNKNNENENDTVVVGLVNRVSDAAPTHLASLCLALLELATTIFRIPVFNGPMSYSLCVHKWCHHVLFRKAQLTCPATRVVLRGKDQTNFPQVLQQASQQLMEEEQQPLPHLIKPNAGGFGAGIVRISTTSDWDQLAVQLDNPSAIVLVQSYQIPQDDYIYRVWFLCGRVQCGMRRRILQVQQPTTTASDTGTSPSAADHRLDTTTNSSSATTGQDATAEFTSGCAGGSSCAWRPKSKRSEPNDPAVTSSAASSFTNTVVSSSPIMEDWIVSDEVRRELEDQLMPVLPTDCHAGSVEFLYGKGVDGAPSLNVDTCSSASRDTTTDTLTSTSSEGITRLYFDLNLLSTLPLVRHHHSAADRYMAGQPVSNNVVASGVERRDDVWDELAMAVANMVDPPTS